MPGYCNGTYNECPENAAQKNYEICNQQKVVYYFNPRIFVMQENVQILINFANMLLRMVKFQFFYFQDEAYFSQECVDEVEKKIKNCNTPGSSLYKLLCNNPNVCKHFICGRPRHILKDTTGFVLGNTICIIPLEHVREGLLEYGANYMKCSGIRKNFCFNGECVNDTKSVNILDIPRFNRVNVALFE
ncbi:hypothetical protein MXB_2376 [Myxobolus squamalis]|nr:hypothetical protein MXB_2376 [Myxobolus squamalis]